MRIAQRADQSSLFIVQSMLLGRPKSPRLRFEKPAVFGKWLHAGEEVDLQEGIGECRLGETNKNREVTSGSVVVME